jgi:hypothetical protein
VLSACITNGLLNDRRRYKSSRVMRSRAVREVISLLIYMIGIQNAVLSGDSDINLNYDRV